MSCFRTGSALRMTSPGTGSAELTSVSAGPGLSESASSLANACRAFAEAVMRSFGETGTGEAVVTLRVGWSCRC